MPGTSTWLPTALRFGDEQAIAITDGVERVLTEDESIALLFVFTGTLTTDGIARLPSLIPGRSYLVKNATTGGNLVKLRGPTGTSGVDIPVGQTVQAFVNQSSALELVYGKTDPVPVIPYGVGSLALPSDTSDVSTLRTIIITGSPAADHTLTLAISDDEWRIVRNAYSTAHNVIIKGSGDAGSGVTIAQGAQKLVFWDSVATMMRSI